MTLDDPRVLLRAVSPTRPPRAAEDIRRLRTLIDSVPAMVAYWDADACNVIANAAYVEWFGTRPEDMLGRHISEILGDAVYRQNLPYIDAVLRGERQRFERTLVDTSGRTRHTQADYVPDVVGADVVGFFVLVSDVTDLVEARRLLAEAERIAELGSWTWDARSGRVLWSDEMDRIAAVEPTLFHPTADTYLELVHPEDRATIADALTATTRGADGFEIDYRIVRPSGEIRHVRGRSRAERRGDRLLLHGTSQDVTAAHLAERALAAAHDRLERSHRLQSDLLALLGHDARQPLSIIAMQLENLIAEWDDEPEESKLAGLRRALRATFAMNELFDDVLAMARVDSDGFVARPARVVVRDAVANALAAMLLDVTVDVEVDADLELLADPWQLRQMLTNLVSNAQKYGEPPITVMARTDGDAVVVEVRDAGAGVAADFVPRLFERFARGEHVGIRGTGFGLHVVKRLVEANAGSVAYRPNAPRGSVFALRLPAAPR